MRGKPGERRAADEIARALEEAPAYAEGDASAAARVHHVQVQDAPEARALRRHLGLTQAGFARRYGFALNALRDWEQGRRRPRAQRAGLLRVIEREPEAVERALLG